MALFSRHRSLFTEWTVLAVLLVALTFFATLGNWLWRLDLAFYDAVSMVWRKPPAKDVVIVAIDDESLQQIGRWPWPRSLHATLLNRLTASRAKAVLLDMSFGEPEPQTDAVLARALAVNGKTVIPLLHVKTAVGEQRQLFPAQELLTAAAAIGHIQLPIEDDGAARSVYLYEGLHRADWPHVALALVRIAHPEPTYPLPPSKAPTYIADAWLRDRNFLIPFTGSPGHFERYGQQVSYLQVLRGDVPADFFTDKIVLVGATANGLYDRYPVPLAGEGQTMSGVEIIANIFLAIRATCFITELPDRTHALLSALLVLLLLIALLRYRSRTGLFLTLGFIALVMLATVALLRFAELWYAPSAVLLCALLAYPLYSWRRLEVAQRYLDHELSELQSIQPTTFERSRDIDPLERRIATIGNARKRLNEATQQREDLLRFLSHDMRSPQAAILSLIDNRSHTSDEDGLYEGIAQYAHRTLKLADNFVQLARAENLNTAHFTRLDWGEIAMEAADEVWALAQQKNIRIKRTIAEQAWVLGDRALLNRVLVNLLENAIKYSVEGTEVSLRLEQAGESWSCQVSDQGSGIDPILLPELFDRFSRAVRRHDRSTKMPGGTGLGLAVVKTVIERHGGRVSVSSQLGQGAQFSIQLPAADWQVHSDE